MKQIKAMKGRFRFQFSARERRALRHLLKQYPVVPAAHQKLSRTLDRPEDQQLLEEALAEHRAAQRRQVDSLLKSGSRFRRHKTGYTLSLTTAQMEWLLQVLNDVRVGCWLALGSPDGPVQLHAEVNEKNLPQFVAHEMSGRFQMGLLEAFSGDGHANPGA